MRNTIRNLVGIPPDQYADDERLIAELQAYLDRDPMTFTMLKDIAYSAGGGKYDYAATGEVVIDIIRERLKS